MQAFASGMDAIKMRLAMRPPVDLVTAVRKKDRLPLNPAWGNRTRDWALRVRGGDLEEFVSVQRAVCRTYAPDVAWLGLRVSQRPQPAIGERRERIRDSERGRLNRST